MGQICGLRKKQKQPSEHTLGNFFLSDISSGLFSWEKFMSVELNVLACLPCIAPSEKSEYSQW